MIKLQQIRITMREEGKVDLSTLGKRTPPRVMDKYNTIVPQVIKANPDLTLSAQGALDLIRTLEYTVGFNLSVNQNGGTPLQRELFNRKLLTIKSGLNIASSEEKQKLREIEKDFSSATERLSNLRDVTHRDADDILMTVLKFEGLSSFDDAIERLTKGPKIEGFEKTDSFKFDFTNDDLRSMLEASFGLETILRSRLLEIAKVDGFVVQCPDIALGNSCIDKYGAKWKGDFLVLPDRKSYDQVEMQLEGIANPEELEHSFKQRAFTDTAQGFAVVNVLEFATEQPSHFDYLHSLPLSDSDKMRAYFLGTIAHEATHAIWHIGIDEAVSDEYRKLVTQELSDTLEHKFVSKYVDHHHSIYKNSKPETLGVEDFAEAVRIYLTNSDYLKRHFPRRYKFIQENLPFVKENAILGFVSRFKVYA